MKQEMWERTRSRLIYDSTDDSLTPILMAGIGITKQAFSSARSHAR